MSRSTCARTPTAHHLVIGLWAAIVLSALLALSACSSSGSLAQHNESEHLGGVTTHSALGSSRPSQSGKLTWTAAVPLGAQAEAYPGDVQCATAALCIAPVLGSPHEWLWDGHSWRGPLPSPALLELSCAPGPFCLGFGESGSTASYATTTDGVTWKVRPLPDSVGGMGLACASSTLCVAATQRGADFAASVFNRTSWLSPQTLVSTGQDPSTGNVVNVDSASCTHTAPGFCMVTAQVNGTQTAVTYTDEGGFSQPIPMGPDSTDTGESSSLTCASATFCLEWQGALTRWDGTSFQPVGGVASNATEVGCASTVFCLATAQGTEGKAGGTYTYDGAEWTTVSGPPALPTTSTSETGSYVKPAAVSCPTSSFCAALFTQYSSVSGSTARAFAATFSR